jgi:hypothetical protein
MASLHDLTTEAGVWEHVKPILGKWTRGIRLTEDDAYALLNCFEDIEKPDDRPVPLPLSQKQWRRAKRHPHSGQSLSMLAFVLEKEFHVEKELRTLRRWCEDGVIPRARKTKGKGGHWRVDWSHWTSEERTTLAEHIGAHARLPKSILQSRRWKNFEKKMKPVWAEYIPLLLELDAALRDPFAENFYKKTLSEPSDEAMRILIKLHQGASQDGMRHLKFRLKARQLFLSEKPLTFEALAKRVGISRRTLFKRYRQQVRDALKSAATPLNLYDRLDEISENLHEEVLAVFADQQQPPSAPTPHRGLREGRKHR